MGVQPVPSLLIKMSLPMMASMLVMALYNIVDSVFVSRISENALTAVSLVYPFQMLFISVAVGTGVGVANSPESAPQPAGSRDAPASSAHKNRPAALFISVVFHRRVKNPARREKLRAHPRASGTGPGPGVSPAARIHARAGIMPCA